VAAVRISSSRSRSRGRAAGLRRTPPNAAANFDQTTRLYNGQINASNSSTNSLTSAGAEKLRREEEDRALAIQHTELSELRCNRP